MKNCKCSVLGAAEKQVKGESEVHLLLCVLSVSLCELCVYALAILTYSEDAREWDVNPWFG